MPNASYMGKKQPAGPLAACQPREGKAQRPCGAEISSGRVIGRRVRRLFASWRWSFWLAMETHISGAEGQHRRRRGGGAKDRTKSRNSDANTCWRRRATTRLGGRPSSFAAAAGEVEVNLGKADQGRRLEGRKDAALCRVLLSILVGRLARFPAETLRSASLLCVPSARCLCSPRSHRDPPARESQRAPVLLAESYRPPSNRAAADGRQHRATAASLTLQDRQARVLTASSIVRYQLQAPSATRSARAASQTGSAQPHSRPRTCLYLHRSSATASTDITHRILHLPSTEPAPDPFFPPAQLHLATHIVHLLPP
jgi:hypothetical protein